MDVTRVNFDVKVPAVPGPEAVVLPLSYPDGGGRQEEAARLIDKISILTNVQCLCKSVAAHPPVRRTHRGIHFTSTRDKLQ